MNDSTAHEKALQVAMDDPDGFAEMHGAGRHAMGYVTGCPDCQVMEHEAEHAVHSDPECELCQDVYAEGGASYAGPTEGETSDPLQTRVAVLAQDDADERAPDDDEVWEYVASARYGYGAVDLYAVPADKPAMSGGRVLRTVVSGITQKLARQLAGELNAALQAGRDGR